MDAYTACGLVEGFVSAESEEQVLEAWQWLIDTGMVWSLQGFYGRAACDLIAAGEVSFDKKRLPFLAKHRLELLGVAV